MKQCSRCSGFLPEAVSHCPNCRTAWPSWLKVTLAAASAGVACVTLSACYGSPCAATLPDGGTSGGRSCAFTTDCDQKLADGGTWGTDPDLSPYCERKTTDAGATDAGATDAGMTADGG